MNKNMASKRLNSTAISHVDGMRTNVCYFSIIFLSMHSSRLKLIEVFLYEISSFGSDALLSQTKIQLTLHCPKAEYVIWFLNNRRISASCRAALCPLAMRANFLAARKKKAPKRI